MMGKRGVKVIICDDHPIVREGLQKIIGKSGDIVVWAEAGSGPELMEKLGEEHFDVVILDISLPGASGLDVLKTLQGLTPRPAVIVLSMHPEEQYALRALKAGAASYLEKASAPDELVTAIRKVARGGRYIGAALAERLAGALDAAGEKPGHENLSDREYQVLCMLASGKAAKEIAAELFLGSSTIGTYRSRIMAKLGLKNTADLVRYAVSNRLVE
jgi:two-component system, NarL family, invasion response regulator UvrY